MRGKKRWEKKNNGMKNGPSCAGAIWRRSMIILFWLCVWQAAAVLTDNEILLVGPVQVGKAFLENLTGPDFIRTVLCSTGRIGMGFLAAFSCGLLFGALSYRYALLGEFFSPVIAVLKSIPVASFVVLLLIWFGSSGLSFYISFLIVFPNVYVNTAAGLKSADGELLEMAEVFGVGRWNRFCFLYRPALMPYLTSCLKVSLGMSWKSGVAAEVIGMPQNSLGERIYLSKIYLDTAGLFAWTLTVILLSFLFEKAVLHLLKKFEEWKPYPALSPWPKERGAALPEICIRNVSKAYGKHQVLSDYSLTLRPGGRYCLMAPSGEGKTTLLHLLNGMSLPDMGTIEGVPQRVGMVFQEDRLCGDYDVAANVLLTLHCTAGCGRRAKEKAVEKIRSEAVEILPTECLTSPVKELSGGMKRRCAVLRAMLSGAEFVVMDEPFTGLDEENRRKTAAFILERQEGRTLLVTTHREEDAKLLSGELIALK